MSTKRTNWATKVRTAFTAIFKTGDRITGETVRLGVRKLVRTKPTHSNSWGGLINNFVKRGLLIDTGKTTAMKLPRSNGRRTPIYIVG